MLFDAILEAMNAKSPLEKKDLIQDLAQIYDTFSKSKLQNNEITINDTSKIHQLTHPSYDGFCTIVHPTKIRRPKSIKSEQSLAKVLHSIVHIEYSAIDLALDAMYRFRNLPLSYYNDWFEVLLEETLHFSLLHKYLNYLGYEYGDFPVHTQLFDAQKATSTLRDRMALLHRGLEANGLDANPFIVLKIQEFEHILTPKLLEILEIILHDEITHVKKGDKWWRYANNNTSPYDFLATLKRFESFYNPPKVLNIKARLMAGFNMDELEIISAFTNSKVFKD